MAGISSKAVGDLPNKYKTFQGQKFDDDLGVNYYSFKYRNHDPQIGRFIQIDPLADDYVYNSTYAFSENKVTGNVELEGLESIPAPLPISTTVPVDVPIEAPGVGGLIGGLIWLENKMDERLKDIYAHPENYPGNKIAEMYLQQRVDKANADAKIELSKPLIQPADTKVPNQVKAETKVGKLPKPAKGKGSVPPDKRDPKRTYTKKEKAEMLEAQDNKCPQCGENKTVDEVDGHHVDRHADGGQTTPENGASVCKSCHTELHK